MGVLIFLDIDGVLRRKQSSLYRLDAACLRAFEQVIGSLPDLQIVITSSWREVFTLWPRMIWMRLSTGRGGASFLPGRLVALAISGDVVGSSVVVNSRRRWLSANRLVSIFRPPMLKEGILAFLSQSGVRIRVALLCCCGFW